MQSGRAVLVASVCGDVVDVSVVNAQNFAASGEGNACVQSARSGDRSRDQPI